MAASVAIDVAADANLGAQYNQGALSGSQQLVQNFTLDLATSQEIYYVASITPSGSATYSIYVSAYEF